MFQIKRNNVVVAEVKATGTLQEKIMGEELVNMSFSLTSAITFFIDDEVEIFGKKYYLIAAPTVEETSSRNFKYTLQFGSIKYKLADTQFLFLDSTNELTIPEFDIVGNIDTILGLIIQNANRNITGWTKGTVDVTEAKLISFSGENCLSAIAKLATEFDKEFWIDKDQTIHFTERKTASGVTLEYGKTNGLKGITKQPFGDSSIVTRLFAVGSEKNIPANYRGGKKRLQMPVAKLEKNINKYGVKEHTEKFEDIFPQRIGTVTAVFANDPFKFTDADIDFDLNATDAQGNTTILIKGTSAKVTFQTGQLAGYELEIAQYGYNTASKTFTLLKNQQETNLEIPGLLFRPAVGDKYIITDIMMPQSYITTAELLLKTKAQEYLDKNCEERFQFTLPADPIYFKNQNISIKIGQTIHVVSDEFSLDANLRILSKTTDINDRFKVQIEVSESATPVSIIKNYIEQQKQQTEIIKAIKYNAATARAAYYFSREFQDKVFDSSGYFDPKNIKPLSIETKMLSVGDPMQQFGLPGITFFIENANTRLRNSAGSLFHLTIDVAGVREWSVIEGTNDNLSEKLNYVYIKAQRVGSNASVYVSESQIIYNSDPDFYFFECGMLSSIIDGYRKLRMTNGYAQLSPSGLSIGRVSSPDGNNYIDFLPDGIDIHAKVTFSDDSPAFNQVIDGIKIGGQNLLLDSNTVKNSYSLSPIKKDLYFGSELDYTFSCDAKATEMRQISIFIIAKEISSGTFVCLAYKDFLLAKANVKQRIWCTEKINISLYEKIIFKVQDNDDLNFVVDISRPKLELGNKATDYSTADEDFDAEFQTQLDRINAVETKTDFLKSTSILGNVVATGVLMVGDKDGSNAGISGTSEKDSQSVRFWAGGKVAEKNNARFQVLDDGTVLKKHANGKNAWIWSEKDGSPVLEYYNLNGTKIMELGERGIVQVVYIPESWIQTYFYKTSFTSENYDAAIVGEITNAITKTLTRVSGKDENGEPFLFFDYSYFIEWNFFGFDYYNGTHPDNAQYSANIGYKINNNSRTVNIADGWYLFPTGTQFSDRKNNNTEELSFDLTINYIKNGKITQSKFITITK